jgi:hypothetical protein
MKIIFRDSSVVEQEAVNFKVQGSNPCRGARLKELKGSFFRGKEKGADLKHLEDGS